MSKRLSAGSAGPGASLPAGLRPQVQARAWGDLNTSGHPDTSKPRPASETSLSLCPKALRLPRALGERQRHQAKARGFETCGLPARMRAQS